MELIFQQKDTDEQRANRDMPGISPLERNITGMRNKERLR